MKYIRILLGMVLILSVSACATMHPDLIAEGHVEVALTQSADIHFSKVDVHEHNGTTQIEVVVRPVSRERLFKVGSINVLVTKPDGGQQKLVSNQAHIDRHRIGSTLQHAHFIISVPRVLDTGTKLTVSYDPTLVE